MLSVVALTNPETISPGQSFNVVWGLCRDASDPPLPAVTAVVMSWGGQRLFPLSGESGAPQTINIDSGRLRRVSSSLPSDFYRVRGTQTINVVVTLAGGRILMASASFRVRIVPLSPSVIDFTGPSMMTSSHYPGDVRLTEWKRPYVVAVNVHNPLIFVTATLTLTLFEVENQRETPPLQAVTNIPVGTPTPVRMSMLTLAPGETRALHFDPPFLKDWTWILEGVWTVNGPLLRGFTYDVRFTATDEFGNNYPEAISPSIRVEVSVSAEKASQQMAALSALTLAGIFSVLGIGWPTGAGIAAGLYQVASGHAAAAKDPPDPDPDFKKRVKMTMPQLSADLKQVPDIKRLQDWLEAAQRIAANRQETFLIEAKTLGAMNAKSRRSEQVQVGDYIKATQQLRADAELLRSAVAPAVAELASKVNLDGWHADLKRWREGKLSSEELQSLGKLLPAEMLGGISEVLKLVEAEQFSLQELMEEMTKHVGDAVNNHVKGYAAQYLEILTQRGEGISALFAQATKGKEKQ